MTKERFIEVAAVVMLFALLGALIFSAVRDANRIVRDKAEAYESGIREGIFRSSAEFEAIRLRESMILRSLGRIEKKLGIEGAGTFEMAPAGGEAKP